MYNIPSAFVRFLGPYVGYSLGAKFMSSAAENGIMSFITKAASTVGLMTVGAMTATMVSCKIGFVFTMGGAGTVDPGNAGHDFPESASAVADAVLLQTAE